MVLGELITAPKPQQCSTGVVRMDPTERHHLLSYLMVPYGQQVSTLLNTIQYVTMQRMHFILFSFLTNFLRKCAQMSFRHESPAPTLCKTKKYSVAEFTLYKDLCELYEKDLMSILNKTKKFQAINNLKVGSM